MADPRYEIPGPVVPDLSPGLAMLASVFNQRRADQRANEYMKMEREAIKNRADRESAAVARQKAEDDRRHAIETFNAMPSLQRMAAKNIGAANMNPYGVKFEEEQAPGQSIGDVDIMGAKGGQYGEYARAKLGQTAPAATPSLQPGEEGPEENPAAEALRFEPSEEAMEGPTAPSGIEQAQDILAQPRNKRLYANYQGQRFEVPKTEETTGLGHEYDTMYQGLLDSGEDPKVARKYVVAQYKSDQTQSSIASRTADQIEARRLEAERSHPSVETQSEFLDRRLKQSDINSRRAANARIASSAPNLKADAANARDMSVLRQASSDIRSTGQYSKLLQSNKTVRSIFANIANGSVPLQHRDAQIQLARFFRQAQPTEGEMHLLYNNLGGTADKWNQFVANLSKGDLSAEQMRQMKASAHAVRREHGEDERRFLDLAHTRLGPGSGFENMPDQAEAIYQGMARELGIENLPPLYQTEGGVQLGSGRRPTVQPRGTKKTALDHLEDELDQELSGGRR